MYYVKIYVYHHTQRLLRQVPYKESCFHVKLLRRHHRRHRSSPSNNTIDVYPQIIVDVPKVLLSKNQLNYLSRTGPRYIRPNQSYLSSNKRRRQLLKVEHQNVKNTTMSYLSRVHHMPSSSPIIKQFLEEIESRLYQRYMAPISYRDVYRTRRELKLIKAIESKLKKEKYVLRFTDMATR